MEWQNVFHCEINEFPRKVLEYWYPNSVSYEDITTTDFTSWRGKVDILTGGFPCQPFSMVGKRLGAEDDRYLWPHMLRAIREIQPTWVVGENVVGLTTMVQPSEEFEVGSQTSLFNESYRTREEQPYTIEEICQGLEREGYSVQPFVIPACAVGAPHRRDRIWIVAHRTDAGFEGKQGWEVNTDEPHAPADTSLRGRVAQQTDNPAKKERRKDNGQQSQRREPSKRADGLPDFPLDTSHPDSNGLENRNANGKQNTQSRHGFKASCRKASWADFPTQSPICGRDDGLSLGLVNITFPKWRAESVKA
ncbi:DNA cytosine methyltransferase [Hoylesella shahii]|nr:DNA cytosine methyltransferase [Hoylesella shahii]